MTVLTLTRADAGYTGNGVLSGGNLTWTSGTGYNRVYSTTKKVLGASGGKYLIEFTFTTMPSTFGRVTPVIRALSPVRGFTV